MFSKTWGQIYILNLKRAVARFVMRDTLTGLKDEVKQLAVYLSVKYT
jgi:hypothetical protein